jgi:hypothetical protein
VGDEKAPDRKPDMEGDGVAAPLPPGNGVGGSHPPVGDDAARGSDLGVPRQQRQRGASAGS